MGSFLQVFKLKENKCKKGRVQKKCSSNSKS